MKSVAIIGAGITGLTAAFYLKRQGIPVVVYDAAGRAGGVIQSVRRDGFLAECGPNTLLETSPKIAQLIRDLQKRQPVRFYLLSNSTRTLTELNRPADVAPGGAV